MRSKSKPDPRPAGIEDADLQGEKPAAEPVSDTAPRPVGPMTARERQGDLHDVDQDFSNPFSVVNEQQPVDPFTGWVPSGPAPEHLPEGDVNPDPGKNSEAIAREQRIDRQEREAEFKQGLAPLMAQRAHFSCAEIAAEVARPPIDQHAHLAIKPDPELRRRVLEQLRDDILAGYFSDGIILLGNTFSAAYFREALAAYPALEFLEFYVEPAYLIRAAAAQWMKGRCYAWPASWDPTLEGEAQPAPAPEAPTPGQPSAKRPSTGIGAKSRRGPGKPPEAYYKPFCEWLLKEYTSRRISIDGDISPMVEPIRKAWASHTEATNAPASERKLPRERQLRKVITRVRDQATQEPDKAAADQKRAISARTHN